MPNHRITSLQFKLLLFLIMVVAGWFRLSSYDFSLPYIDHPDEPNYYLEALKWRGFYEPGGEIPGYPPGILVINSVVQTILGDDGLKMPDVIRLVRLLSLTINLMTLVLVAFIARRLAGFLAGLIAAIGWGIAPLLMSGGVYATADPYTYFFTVMAVWLALVALQNPRRSRVAVWSVIAGLAAVLFKYPLLPALLPGFLVIAYGLFTHRRKQWRALIWQVILVSTVGVFLLFVYQAGRMDIREANTIRTSGLSNMVNLEYVANNLFHVFVPIGGVFAVLITAIGIARIIAVERFNQRSMAILICLVPLISIPWIAAAVSLVTVDGRIKDVLPATALASALLGVGVVELGKLFGPQQRYIHALVVGLLTLGVWLPLIQADVRYMAAAQLPDRRVDIRHWADQNLVAGTVIVDGENHKTFNPQWSGLVDNAQWFDWLETGDVLQHTAREWREDFGASYMALNAAALDRIENSEAGQRLLDEMLLLRAFTSPPRMRGPETLFYRLWKPDHALEVTFGDQIRLTGYDVDKLEASPGATLQFTFYWNAMAVPSIDYSLFLHLLPADALLGASPVTQYDGPPVSTNRPTYTWDEPNETLISQSIVLTLPQAVEAGTYKLMIGLYDWSTLVRLPVAVEGDLIGDAYELLQIGITP